MNFLARQTKALTLVLALIACVATTMTAQSQEADLSLVVLFGDSISHGFNGNLSNRFSDSVGNGRTDRGCPAIYLANILNKQEDRDDGPPDECRVVEGDSTIRDSNEMQANAIVQNWGNGGSSSMAGVQRMSGDLSSAASTIAAQQKFALILYGTNDFNFGISSDVTRANIEVMIDIARSQNYVPIVSTLIPRAPGVSQGQSQNLAEYNAAINSAIANRNADKVDLHARFINEPGGFLSLLDPDQLHPTDPGYLVIAETWFSDFLQGQISAVPVRSDFQVAPIILLLLDDD